MSSFSKHLFFLIAFGVLSAPALLAQVVDNGSSDDDDEVVVLEEFAVRSSSNTNEYVASEAISGTRVGAQILEVPFNVQVITGEFLEDFQLENEYDALPTVAGYSPGGGDARLRGFEPLKLRDLFSRAGPSTPANTKQVEAIMGPQSALYGQASPGGILNYISKRPRRNFWNRIMLATGNYDYRRAEIEFNGPAVRNKLFYMLNVAYNYREGEADFSFNDRRSYLLGITYLITRRTSLSVNWEQQFTKSIGAPGMPQWVIGGRANSGDPGGSGGFNVGPYTQLKSFNRQGPHQDNTSRFDSLSALLEHRFNRIFSARLNTLYFHRDWDDESWTSGLQLDQTTMRMRARQPMKRLYWIDNYAVQAEGLAQFRTGALEHMFLVAADYIHDVYDNKLWYLPTSGENAIGNVLSLDTRFLDPFNPKWETVDYSLLTRVGSNLHRIYDHEGFAASLRTFALNRKLITSFSTRYSHTKARIRDHVAGIDSTSHDYGTVYSLGVNYKLAGNAAVVYANTSTSYEPTTTYDKGRKRTVPPEKGKGYEAGIKGSFFQKKINYTLSLYHIVKENVRSTNHDFDMDIPGSVQYFVTGKVRVRGAELSTTMVPAKGFTIMAGAACMDSKIIEHENPLAIGRRPEYVPRYKISLLSSYAFNNSVLKGFRIRASTSLVGDRLSQHDNDSTSTKNREYITPSLFLMSTGATYGFKQRGRVRHEIALDIQNLLDKEYYSPGAYNPGRGRSYSVTYRINF